jgi:GT2 family glycosyltransferase
MPGHPPAKIITALPEGIATPSFHQQYAGDVADGVISARWPTTRCPELSVVIVTWNAEPDLVTCLESLRAQPPDLDWEAIVVDNASSDQTVDRVRLEFPGVRLIANPRNRGLAAGNNQGIAASRGRYVLVSNPDVIYRPESINPLVELLERRQRAAFAIARLEHIDGQIQVSAGDLPSARESLFGRRLSRRRSGGGPSGVWWHDWAHDEERQIEHGAEACYLVRRDAIGEIGLQDERYVLDWEGLDWSARARDAGWEIWFCPAAAVTHLGGVSVRQVPGRWIGSTHLGMYLYLRSRTPIWARPVLGIAIGARALTKFFLMSAGAQLYARSHRDESRS